MKTKRIFGCLVALLVFVVSAPATTVVWYGTTSNAWNVGSNWSSDVPAVGDNAHVYGGTAIITDARAADQLRLSSDYATDTGIVTIASGGSLQVLGGAFAQFGGSVGTLNVQAGGSFTSTGAWTVGTGGSATMVIDGTVQVNGQFSSAHGSTGTANITIGNGGSLTVGGIMYHGYSGTSVITVNAGGSLACTGPYIYSPGHGSFVVGGTITTPALYHNPNIGNFTDIVGNGKVYVTTLSELAEISSYLLDGRLKGNGIDGNVNISAWDGSKYTLTVIPEPATLMILALGGLFLKRRAAK
jgi:hypothetical protein